MDKNTEEEKIAYKPRPSGLGKPAMIKNGTLRLKTKRFIEI